MAATERDAIRESHSSEVLAEPPAQTDFSVEY